MQIFDLSMPLNQQTPCYPTDPHYQHEWAATFKTDGCFVSKLTLCAHSGTHIDSPLHFTSQGTSIDKIGLTPFIGEALVINAPKCAGENLTTEDIEPISQNIHPQDIVLFHTGWSTLRAGPAFFQDEWPGFDPQLIDYLAQKGVKAIGGDIASADSPSALQNGAPAHRLAASLNLPIIEALVNLNQLIGQRCFFIGLPLFLEGLEASPIRAIAVIDPHQDTFSHIL